MFDSAAMAGLLPSDQTQLSTVIICKWKTEALAPEPGVFHHILKIPFLGRLLGKFRAPGPKLRSNKNILIFGGSILAAEQTMKFISGILIPARRIIGSDVDFLAGSLSEPKTLWIIRNYLGVSNVIHQPSSILPILIPFSIVLVVWISISASVRSLPKYFHYGMALLAATSTSRMIDWILFKGARDWISLPGNFADLSDVTTPLGIILAGAGIFVVAVHRPYQRQRAARDSVRKEWEEFNRRYSQSS